MNALLPLTALMMLGFSSLALAQENRTLPDISTVVPNNTSILPSLDASVNVRNTPYDPFDPTNEDSEELRQQYSTELAKQRGRVEEQMNRDEVARKSAEFLKDVETDPIPLKLGQGKKRTYDGFSAADMNKPSRTFNEIPD